MLILFNLYIYIIYHLKYANTKIKIKFYKENWKFYLGSKWKRINLLEKNTC